MWSHYSQNHTGFCLEFDTSFEPFDKVHKVYYQQEFPKLDLAPLLSAEFDPFLDATITAKYKCWRYEREWRVIHKQSTKEFHLGVNALTGVYFGCGMPLDHQKLICSLLAGSPTQFYQMKMDTARFAVHPTEVDYTPSGYGRQAPTGVE